MNEWRIVVGDNALNYRINEWKHVFKLDPAKAISDEHLEQLCESGTDAIIVGGTDQITIDNVLDLLYRVRRYAIPCALEVSEMDAITPGLDRKSTRLNSSHVAISYAVFCLNIKDVVT